MSSSLRRELELELEELRDQELAADAELDQSFESVLGGGGVSGGNGNRSSGMRFTSAFDLSVVSNSLSKIEGFSPHYEAMAEGTRKLSLQVEDCRALSDRINVIVRRLDSMQIRSQKALACTEDIINLKESKAILQTAIDERNLHAAVRCIQMVQHIDKQAADASEDYQEILRMEVNVKELVQADFDKAISNNELNEVMSLCPLLQTLGLETTARDRFLEFVSANVFIAVSADGESVGASTDPASGYAQALSGVFNSSYLILQKYLPLVIQGMENSLGDIHFVAKLHSRAEKQAGLVLKRYMKYRNCKEVILSVKSAGVDGDLAAVAIGAGGGGTNVAGDVVSVENAAGLHEMLDELMLLIQYCCLYSKYLWQLCDGAKRRVRPAFSQSQPSAGATDNAATEADGGPEAARARTTSSSSSSNGGVGGAGGSGRSRRARSRTLSTAGGDDENTEIGIGGPEGSGSSAKNDHTAAIAVTEIFPGPLTFDKIVDELINSYYMEGERWIMHKELRKMIKGQRAQQRRREEAAEKSVEAAAEFANPFNDGLDEAFFVLQRCGQRAIATNNVHAACAVLHLVGDLVASELLSHISEGMATSTRILTGAVSARIGTMVNLRGVRGKGGSGTGSGDGAGGEQDEDEDEYVLDRTIMRGYKNAVQLATSTMQAGGQADTQSQLLDYSQRIQAGMGGMRHGGGGAFEEHEDPYGVSEWLQVYNTAEKCARYSERLGADVSMSGEVVYADEGVTTGGASGADDADKIKLCQEGFSTAAHAFRSALTGELDSLAKGAGKVMKDLLNGVFGPSGPQGGIKFDLPDDRFESQASLTAAPAALTRTMEVIIDMTTLSLGDNNRDSLLGLLAEQFCDRLEHFIAQQSFSFCGALKMEESVRGVMTVFNQKAGVGQSLRSRFGRMKEVMMVLTSDVVAGSKFTDSLAQLTYSEAETFLGLRVVGGAQ